MLRNVLSRQSFLILYSSRSRNKNGRFQKIKFHEQKKKERKKRKAQTILRNIYTNLLYWVKLFIYLIIFIYLYVFFIDVIHVFIFTRA